MKVKALIILFSVITSILTIINADEIDIHGCVFNLKGWNIPDISKLKKILVEETKILEDLPRIRIEYYKYVNGDKKNYTKPYVILNKITKDGIVDLREDLSTYQREWVKSLKLFKIENGEKILCYQYECAPATSPSDTIREYLQSIKEQRAVLVGGVFGSVFSVYIADLDNDGIYESKFNAYNNEYALYSILRSKFRKFKRRNKIETILANLKKAWKKYLDFPSTENAKKVYSLIPDSDFIKNQKETNDEKELWNWIWLTLPVLEKEMYAGDRNAVRVAFKLYPICRGTYSTNLDMIIAHFARVNPKMFLEELKKHRKLVTPQQAIEGSWGFEYMGLAKVRYLTLQNTIKALKSVKDSHLNRIRNECINYLEKQKNYLKRHFDITFIN